MFTSYRICPTCNGAFEVDRQTKQRQAVFIVLATVSLILTILMYFDFRQWAIFAIPSCLMLGALISSLIGAGCVMLIRAGTRLKA